MHPQRTLIEAAEQVFLNEIVNTYSYDHEYHRTQYETAINAPHIQDLEDTNPDAYKEELDHALKVHNPMKWHTQEAADSLASAHKQSMKRDGTSISQAESHKIMAPHGAGFISSIQRDHPIKYGYPKQGEDGDVAHMRRHHSSDFVNMARGKLVRTHKLKLTDAGGIEDI